MEEIVEVLRGIQTSLDQQNQILERQTQVLEKINFFDHELARAQQMVHLKRNPDLMKAVIEEMQTPTILPDSGPPK
jgi:hypothetical protein